MEIIRTSDSGQERVALTGRLDSNSSPELERTLGAILDEGITRIELDLSKLAYLSSAGLRVLLATHKKCAAKSGEFSIAGVSKIIQEIFDVTGFAAILNITSFV